MAAAPAPLEQQSENDPNQDVEAMANLMIDRIKGVHSFLRKERAVSLRDVERCLLLQNFFYNQISCALAEKEAGMLARQEVDQASVGGPALDEAQCRQQGFENNAISFGRLWLRAIRGDEDGVDHRDAPPRVGGNGTTNLQQILKPFAKNNRSVMLIYSASLAISVSWGRLIIVWGGRNWVCSMWENLDVVYTLCIYYMSM